MTCFPRDTKWCIVLVNMTCFPHDTKWCIVLGNMTCFPHDTKWCIVLFNMTCFILLFPCLLVPIHYNVNLFNVIMHLQ